MKIPDEKIAEWRAAADRFTRARAAHAALVARRRHSASISSSSACPVTANPVR